MQPYVPPKPGYRSGAGRLGGVLARGGRSILNLLPRQAYTVQMGQARIGRRRVFLVNAPETVRSVLVTDAQHYPKHHYIEDILRPLIGVSLFNANGADWAQQRRLVDQAFAAANLRRAFPLMRAAVDDLLDRLARRDAREPWPADVAMAHVTADIIFRTILSTPLAPEPAQQVHDAFRSYQENAQRVMALSALHLPTWLHRWRCRQMGARIRASFAPLVHARYAAVARGEADLPQDMLAALIAARDPDTGARLSAAQAVDQVATLFLAGHETSASTLAWALYLLACQPELQQQVRDEVAAAWGDRAPEFGDTRHLALTQDVFKETLRLYPPIAFYLREAAEAGRCLRDKPVAQGDMVAVSPWIVHRHEGLWAQPDVFDPCRFRTEAGLASARGAYLPFGMGPRACPGAAFATQESLLLLAQIVRRFRIETVAGAVPVPVARLTLRALGGVRLCLRPVRSPSGVPQA
ncbi:MAG: cytochrome P450 [Rhodoferax sp.]|nr:cytochrome P450 [Rhodoferax sp.]